MTLISILLLTVPVLSGCWDRIEIEQRAAVLGLALDIPDGESASRKMDVTHPPGKTDVSPKLLLTAYIAVPGRISLGPGSSGGGGGGGSSTKKAIWKVQGVGVTVSDALTNMQQHVAETLFLGHLRVIVVSQDLAKRDLTNVNDYFRRSPQIRRTTWMMVSKERAVDLMGISPPMEQVPPLYVLRTMDRAKDMGKLPNDFVGNFWTLVSSDGQEGYLPCVSKVDEDNIKVAGLACFRGNKLKMITSPFEIMSFMEIKGENPAGYRIPVKVRGTNVSIAAFRRLAHLQTKIENGTPTAQISIHIDANVAGKDQDGFSLQDPRVIQAIRQNLNRTLKESCLAFIQKTQENRSDIFGFGENIRAKHPLYWRNHIGSKAKWEEWYPHLKVEINVRSRIHRLEMKTT